LGFLCAIVNLKIWEVLAGMGAGGVHRVCTQLQCTRTVYHTPYIVPYLVIPYRTLPYRIVPPYSEPSGYAYIYLPIVL